jgi:Zinc knuckle
MEPREEVIRDLETPFKRVIDHITAIVLPVKHKHGATLSNNSISSLPTGPGKQTNSVGESRNKVQDSQDTPGLYSTISKNVRSFAEKLTEPMLKRPYQAVNPPTTQVFTQEPSHLIEGHTKRTAPSRGIRRSRAFQKISQIKADRAKGVITCYRCGEKNHLSRDCRNPIICFECGKVGHRSSNCRSISQPKPSFSISSNPPILPIRGSNMDK